MNRSHHLRTSAHAFTLVETCVSVVIVGVMLAAVLQTVGASGVAQYKLVERARGKQLGRALINEIIAQAYEDPTSPVFGPESGEASTAAYDDVDDYHGLGETSPRNKDGSSITLKQPTTWSRTVTVMWVNPLTLAVASPQAETGAKLVTVTVKHNNVVVATLKAVKTNAP